jgi:hypothetical protein
VTVQALHRVKIKIITFTAYYWNKRELKAAQNRSTRRAKDRQKKGTAVEKRKTLTLARKFPVAEGVVAYVDEDVDE